MKPITALVAATSMACLMTCVLPASIAFADAPAPSASTNDVLGDQKQIRNQTEKATTDLNALILEFDRNGLGEGADVQLLKGIQKALNNLTEKDMQEVIAILESIRKGGNLSDTLQRAFDKQKGISTQLQTIIIQYMHEQDLADVALRLTRLADRENQNMRSGTSLYRATKGASPKSYNEVQKAQVQVQQSEQQAIYAEAKVLIERLGTLAKAADPATAEHLNAVIAGAQKGKLETTLSGAADDLHSSNLFSAVGKERVARDLLRDLARLVAPAKEAEDVLKEAAANLAQAIRDENYISQQSKTITPADKDSTDTIAQLDDRSADNVDIADSVRKDILTIIPDAVADLKKAEDTIQASRKDLSDAKGKETSDLAALAAKQLNDARQKILDQVARIEEQKKADTKIAKEKALLDQIIALRKSQELLQTDTSGVKNSGATEELATRQATLAKNCHDLQATALTDAAIVAPNLDTAAKDMDDSHTALAAQKTTDSAKPQQVAIDELKKAEALLAKDIASLEKKKEDLAKLEKARDQVAQMIKDQAKAEQQTNKQAANDNKPKDGDPSAKDLAKAEDQIAKQADQTGKDVADTAPQAAQNLQKASQNADAAKNELNKPDANAADQQERQAQNNLDKAKADIDKQIAQLKQDLDEQNDNAAQLADAANKIEQAQNDIANAQQDPMQQLQNQQQQIANDLKNLPQDAPGVQDAAQAAAQAAQDLANNDLDKAGQDMQKAQDGMQKAQDNAKTPDGAKAKLPDLQKRQEDAKNQLAALKNGDTPPDAASQLADAANQAADAQAQDSAALPADANAALAEAKQALSDAAAAKAAGKDDKGATDKAKAALDKAKASVAMAQAGLGTGPDQAKGPGQGKPEPGKGDQPGKIDENSASAKDSQRIDSTVNASSSTGPNVSTNGNSGFSTLPARDRDAIQQSRAEKYPEEYGSMIEQYLKNLSDQNNK